MECRKLEMISGLNEEVEILGRRFHFQTELSQRDRITIRTEVFVGGKLVATREMPLSMLTPAQLDEETTRAAIKTRHNTVIESTVERARRYHDRQAGGALQPEPEDTAATDFSAYDACGTGGLKPPSDEARETVRGAVHVRQIFGKLRLRLGFGHAAMGDNEPRRIAMAARGFAWITGLPTFREIRVDEQIRCNMLKYQIAEWLESDRDPEKAREIWSEIVSFNHYLAEINQRTSLLAFDRQLLAWAACNVQEHGMSDAVLDHLQWLFGRDRKLDRVLDQPQGVAGETWSGHLCRVLKQLPAESARA